MRQLSDQLPVEVQRAHVLHELLLLAVEDQEINVLVAQLRQLHGFFDQAALAFRVRHRSATLVLNFLQRASVNAVYGYSCRSYHFGYDFL